MKLALQALRDARGHTTSFAYNEQGKISSTINHLNQAEVNSYNLDGNLVAKTNRLGHQFTYVYNGNNRLIHKLFPGDAVNYAYNDDSLLLEVTDNDSSVTRTYNLKNQMTSEVGSHYPGRVEYSYNERGEKTGVKLFLSGQDVADIKRSYFATGNLNRVSGYVLGTKAEFERQIDQNSRLSRINYPNGVWTQMVYDKNSRVSEQITQTPSSLAHKMVYRYNGNGNITTVQEVLNNQQKVSRYKYDELNRLVEEDAVDKRSYNLDLLGNNLSYGGQYNALNQLLEDVAFTYEYDLNGNRTKKTSKVNGERFEYSFSPENQLQNVKLYKSGNVLSKTILYTYDGVGRRIVRSVQNHLESLKSYTRKYIYDGDDILAVLDGNNSLLLVYLNGEGIDDPILMVSDVDGDGEMNVLSLVKDRQNSVRFILNEKGDTVQSIEYSAYGETQITRSSRTNYRVPNTCYYTSRELEQETGEYYYRARYYDPRAQKFLSEDPIGIKSKDLNLYRYVNNNPLLHNDPSGLIINDQNGLVSMVMNVYGNNPDMFELLNFLQQSSVVVDVSDAWLPDDQPGYLLGRAVNRGNYISVYVDTSKIANHGQGYSSLDVTIHELLHARNFIQGFGLYDEVRVRQETDDLTKPMCQ